MLLTAMLAELLGECSCVTRENRSGGNNASKEKGCQKEETLVREKNSRKNL
jgi:hypothetical protein